MRKHMTPTAVAALGLLIEGRTDGSLKDAFEERLFEPAGLHDTYFPQLRHPRPHDQSAGADRDLTPVAGEVD